MHRNTPIPENWKTRPVLKVAQAAAITAQSIPSTYRAVQRGELELVKIAERSSAITTSSLIKFLTSRGVEVL